MKITLDSAAYWKLRAVCGDTQRLQVMQQAIAEQIGTAQKKQAALVADLALEHGFPENPPTFQMDDETLTINIPEPVAQ
jgi:hypothetical protein